jgi:hypothetical protein
MPKHVGEIFASVVCVYQVHGALVLCVELYTMRGTRSIKKCVTYFCAKFNGSLVILITPNGRRNYFSHFVAIQQERLTQKWHVSRGFIIIHNVAPTPNYARPLC